MSEHFISAWDVEGRDVTLTVSSVEIVGYRNVLSFKETPKKLMVGETIRNMFPTPIPVGHRVTLYADQIRFGASKIRVVRVR